MTKKIKSQPNLTNSVIDYSSEKKNHNYFILKCSHL